MLVLTRRLNQVITIGDSHGSEAAIEVTVMEVRGDQVRLSITAPQSLPVHRKEIWLDIVQGNTRLEK